jgi:hypothetical protein
MPDTSVPRYRLTDLFDRLPAHAGVAPWMLRDGDTASALWILSTFDPGDVRVWGNIRYHLIDFDAMFNARGWSPAELALLRAAASITGTPMGQADAVDLRDLATQVDDDRWSAFLCALAIRRELVRG